jgi:hypothetical protein
MEAQFADLAAEVTGVRLAEVLGVLSEQADEEVGPAEVAVGEFLQPGPGLRARSPPSTGRSCTQCYMHFTL